ncbi:penicillin acylase family protein [Sphingomonas sp.]|uniref:penicillin acylase family protein n=1 Tax=Sphingomonas sp. TaxID=28214 RepID=UPI001B082000|nr:penicillin acylase family protein [Sphingomonas sp.]MBO9715061.1 penicillin acylase family protein [Sphingomonas sp.]
MSVVRRAGLALAAALLATPAAAAPPPRYSVTVTRTAEGVVHLDARDMGSLGYGSGYTAAEDNGCIVADTLVTVRGERSRYFGAKAKVTVGFNDIADLESDFFHRAIGELPELERAFRATSRDNRLLLDGFVAGYNRYLRDHPEGFAAECRGAAWLAPMTHQDMLLLVNAAMVQGSASRYARFIANAAPPAAPAAAALLDLPAPAPLAREGLGSNGWAFGAEATATGRGILVGNPHFPWAGNNRFRRLHMRVEGKLDVMGAGLVTSPFIAIGFNKDVAWTHTVTTSQHMTLEQLALDPADPTVYVVDGRRETMKARVVTVAVKDAAPVARTLYATRYGVMIAIPASGLGWGPATAYSIRDANQANFRSGDAWLAIARAHTAPAVRDAAARTLGIPYVNTIAADRYGSVMYSDISAVPDISAEKLAECGTGQGSKPDSEDASIFLLDGARSACDWTVDRASPVPGLMPLKDLPVALRRDWVANSNDSYWLANSNSPLSQLAPILGPWGTRQSLRTRSGIAVISAALAAGKLDMDRVRALVLENRVEAARLVLDDLLKLCPQRETLAPACTALAAWDRHADNDSKGALLFFSFWRRAAAIKDFWAIPFDPASPATTPSGLNLAAAPAILDALQGAVAELGQFNVPLDAPLGQVQVAPRGNERIPIHGGPSAAGVLNAMHALPTAQGLVPFHGTSYVQLVTFDDKGPVADSLLSYSQSSNPDSPWFADGTRAYSAKRWLRLPFTPAEIAAQRVGQPLALSE